MNRAPQPRRRLRSSRLGFTLVELMVAMAVLSLLLLLFSQMASSLTSTSDAQRQRADNFSTARVVLGRLDVDLEGLVRRSDLPLFPVSGGESVLGFMTLTPGILRAGDSAIPRAISYVEYDRESAAPNPPATVSPDHIDRSDLAYDWTPSSLPPFGTTGVPSATVARMIAKGIFGFQYVFLNQTSTTTATGTSTSVTKSITFVNAPTSNSSNGTTTTTQTTAISVSLLVMDDSSMNQLSPSQITSLITAFTVSPGDLTDSTKEPSTVWQASIQTLLASGAYPKKSLQSLRWFERTYILPVSAS